MPWVSQSLRCRLGTVAVSGLPVCFQHSADTGFAGQVNALIGQHGDDTRRRYRGIARLVGDRQYVRALGQRPAIAADEAINGFPELQVTQSDTRGITGHQKARTNHCVMWMSLSKAWCLQGQSLGLALVDDHRDSLLTGLTTQRLRLTPDLCAAALGMLGLVFLPEEVERNAFTPQFAMHGWPIGFRSAST